jgi:hypothetical protein
MSRMQKDQQSVLVSKDDEKANWPQDKTQKDISYKVVAKLRINLFEVSRRRMNCF